MQDASPNNKIWKRRCSQDQSIHTVIFSEVKNKNADSRTFENNNCNKNLPQFLKFLKIKFFLNKITHRKIIFAQEEIEVESARPA